MPLLLSPINSFEGAVKVIDAGADEIYCGVAMQGEHRHFTLFRGPGASPAQLPTYDELERITEYAHRHNVKVIPVINEPFMSEALEKEVKNHICSCVEKGADALIIGDLGVLSIVKDVGVEAPLYASTYFVSMNCEAVDFLRKLGFSRVILERHLTIHEISEIVSRSKVDIEVFCHWGGCSNINANCYFYHHNAIPGFAMKRALKKAFDEKDPRSMVFSPCTLFYGVYDVSNGKKMCDVPILDAFTGCSLCHLQALIHAGVSGLKIVGRYKTAKDQETWTRIYRELLDFIWHGRSRIRHKKMREKINSLKNELGRTHIEIYCKQKRCFFSPLFNVPYESLIPSWELKKARRS